MLHLHGELMKVRAIDNDTQIYELESDSLDTSQSPLLSRKVDIPLSALMPAPVEITSFFLIPNCFIIYRKLQKIKQSGKLMKVRAIDNDTQIYELESDSLDTTPDTIINGHHVRPHIVFFQEAVPCFELCLHQVMSAGIIEIVYKGRISFKSLSTCHIHYRILLPESSAVTKS